MKLLAFGVVLVSCASEPPKPVPTPASSYTYEPGTICGVRWPPVRTCTVLHDPYDTRADTSKCPDLRPALASFGEPLTADQSALLDAVAREMKQIEHLSLVRIVITPSSLEPIEVAQARGRAIATLLGRRGIDSARLDVFVGRSATGVEEPSRVAFVPAACEGAPIAPKT